MDGAHAQLTWNLYNIIAILIMYVNLLKFLLKKCTAKVVIFHGLSMKNQCVIVMLMVKLLSLIIMKWDGHVLRPVMMNMNTSVLSLSHVLIILVVVTPQWSLIGNMKLVMSLL